MHERSFAWHNMRAPLDHQIIEPLRLTLTFSRHVLQCGVCDGDNTDCGRHITFAVYAAGQGSDTEGVADSALQWFIAVGVNATDDRFPADGAVVTSVAQVEGSDDQFEVQF